MSLHLLQCCPWCRQQCGDVNVFTPATMLPLVWAAMWRCGCLYTCYNVALGADSNVEMWMSLHLLQCCPWCGQQCGDVDVFTPATMLPLVRTAMWRCRCLYTCYNVALGVGSNVEMWMSLHLLQCCPWCRQQCGDVNVFTPATMLPLVRTAMWRCRCLYTCYNVVLGADSNVEM